MSHNLADSGNKRCTESNDSTNSDTSERLRIEADDRGIRPRAFGARGDTET